MTCAQKAPVLDLFIAVAIWTFLIFEHGALNFSLDSTRYVGHPVLTVGRTSELLNQNVHVNEILIV